MIDGQEDDFLIRGHGTEDQHIAHESGNPSEREIGHRDDLGSDQRVGRVVHRELSATALATEVGGERSAGAASAYIV